ncbi:MAG: glycosyltransferase [Lachnospiraceae bacterium]
MIGITICVIMKNEERHLDAFLSYIQEKICKPVRELCFEILLVDTGSEDGSVGIAKKHGARVESISWEKDFSAARNAAIALATYDWILVLDCDEYVKSFEEESFIAFMEQNPHEVGMLVRKNYYVSIGLEQCFTDEAERFFHREEYHYENTIHEQVRRRDGKDYRRIRISLEVDHVGYQGGETDVKQKARRNLELLLLELENKGEDPYLYFQIGQSYQVLGDIEKTYTYFGKGLEYDVDPRAKYVQMMVNGYGYAMLNTGRERDALAYRGIYSEFCEHADFLTLMGLIYLRNGEVDCAIAEFEQALQCKDSDINGTNSFIPSYNLGCIYEVLGNVEKARNYYTACGEFPPAVNRLKQL